MGDVRAASRCRAARLQPQVAVRRIAQQWVLAVDAGLFGRGKLRPAARRRVLAVPDVAGEPERLRRGLRPNVDGAGPLVRPEYDDVVLEAALARRHEAGRRRLLQDAQRPALRPVDRVVTHHRAVDAHEGDRRAAADKRVSLYRDAGGLGQRPACQHLERRTEELQAGAPADVNGAAAGVLEPAAAYDDVGRAALGLHADAALLVRVPKPAALDNAVVAADHIDTLAIARAPEFDRTLQDVETLDAGELQPVVIAARPDVADVQPPADDAGRRRVVSAAVVDVDPVVRAAFDDQVVQLDAGAGREVQPRSSAVEHGRICRVCRRDADGLRPAVEALEVESAAVPARRDADDGAWLRAPHRPAKRVRRAD